MLRHDGAWIFYKIQHQQKSKEWVFSSFDYFGTPPTGDNEKEGDLFSACGHCWQKLGEHGVFSLRKARKGLEWMKKHHKGFKFRIVSVRIEQEVEPV